MRLTLPLSALALAACAGPADGQSSPNQSGTAAAPGTSDLPPDAGAMASVQSTEQAPESPLPFTAQVVADFTNPWAIAFLPGTNRALITEQQGALKLWEEGGAVRDVAGVPQVDYGGQGGLGDVVLAPDFATTGDIYLSYIEAGAGDTRGAVVVRAHLSMDGEPRLTNIRRIWEQTPKVTGRGHYSHRIAFSPDGRYLWITSGERMKGEPAQDLTNNLGSTLRLFPDGSVPPDNPFVERGGATAQVWSYGHRNLLGIDFDSQGRLWTSEMGPKGGDEINREVKGANYGWPVVSNGDVYDGSDIPDHSTRPTFRAPATWWTPVISPAGLLFVDGTRYPGWQGDALLPGLSSKGLVRVEFSGDLAREVARYPLFGKRIRAVAEAPDGTIWVLEDERADSQGRLIRLAPR